jgi:hypothetical protein
MAITYKRLNSLTEEVLRDGTKIGTVSRYAAVDSYWLWIDMDSRRGNTTSKDEAVAILTKGK